MILTGTTEKIEIVLSGGVQTAQATFHTSYNQITNSSLIPFEQNGTTNGFNAVNILDSPSSGYINQLKSFYLENNDTSDIICNIRYNNNDTTYRTIYRAVLNMGNSLRFDLDNGWFVSDGFGGRKYASTNIYPAASINYPTLSVPLNSTSLSLTTNIVMINLGKADAAYSSITIAYLVSQAAATITWAEMGIYRVAQPMGIGTQQLTRRCGFINTASIWNSIGAKYTNIPVSGIEKGDDLYVVFGNIATTTAAFRGASVADDLTTILRCINNAAATWRPSLTENMTASSFGSTIAGVFVAWQGFAPSV